MFYRYLQDQRVMQIRIWEWVPLHYTQTIHGTGIYAYIHPWNNPNVGKYGIHWWSGL